MHASLKPTSPCVMDASFICAQCFLRTRTSFCRRLSECQTKPATCASCGSFASANLQRLREALDSFPEGGSGIVATVPADDGTDIVASAVFFVGEDPTTCEFAITVQSSFSGVGLATTLLTALIDAARTRGLKTMEGFVLKVNAPMLRLAQRLGFSVASDPDDGAIRICRLDLAAV